MSEHNPLYFMSKMREFLTALSQTYPDCLKVRGYELAFKTQTKRKSESQLMELGVNAVQTYKRVMEPWYERCLNRDESLLGENIKFLNDLNLPSKWTTMDRNTKGAVWEFIIQLNYFCGGPAPQEEVQLPTPREEEIQLPPEITQCLDIMPEGVKKNILDISQQYSSKIYSGEMKLTDLNIFEVAQNINNTMDPTELENFRESIESGEVSVDMTTMLSQMPPGIMSSQMAAFTGLLGGGGK
jgi:hypothetical protein